MAAAKTSEYVVLFGTDNGWIARDLTEHAVSSLDAMQSAAIRHLNETGDTPEMWVAIPARSWKPRTRRVEQVMKESWS